MGGHSLDNKRCNHRENTGIYYRMRGDDMLFECPDCGQVYRFTTFKDNMGRKSICEVEVSK